MLPVESLPKRTSLSTRLPVAYLQTDHASNATIRKQHTLLDLLGPGVCGADTDGDANGRWPCGCPRWVVLG